MIKDEEYIGFLKSIISCISHGDYYSVKELSNLELERMKKIQKEKEKNRFSGRISCKGTRTKARSRMPG